MLGTQDALAMFTGERKAYATYGTKDLLRFPIKYMKKEGTCSPDICREGRCLLPRYMDKEGECSSDN